MSLERLLLVGCVPVSWQACLGRRNVILTASQRYGTCRHVSKTSIAGKIPSFVSYATTATKTTKTTTTTSTRDEDVDDNDPSLGAAQKCNWKRNQDRRLGTLRESRVEFLQNNYLSQVFVELLGEMHDRDWTFWLLIMLHGIRTREIQLMSLVQFAESCKIRWIVLLKSSSSLQCSLFSSLMTTTMTMTTTTLDDYPCPINAEKCFRFPLWKRINPSIRKTDKVREGKRRNENEVIKLKSEQGEEEEISNSLSEQQSGR